MNDARYNNCVTGEDCHKVALWLKEQERKDINNAQQAYNSYCIHKLMTKYKMPYRDAEKEFLIYGMNRLGLGI